ncbi:MAG: hypothetical protein U0575_14305 [Phycisphaerales bacterium]
MNTSVIRFSFAPNVSLADAEASLLLAAVATEGLLGETAVRLDLAYFVDPPRRAILVDGTSEVGFVAVRIFTQLLAREFGGSAFEVLRIGSPGNRSPGNGSGRISGAAA